jgi:hypothetical protein
LAYKAYEEKKIKISSFSNLTGLVPESSSDVSVEYKSNNEARIRWKHFDDERLQHYEVL